MTTWYLRRADFWIGPFESSQAAATYRKVWDLGDYTVVRAPIGRKAATPHGFASKTLALRRGTHAA